MNKNPIIVVGAGDLIPSVIDKYLHQSVDEVVIVSEKDRGLIINPPTPYKNYYPMTYMDEPETAKMRRAENDRRQVTPPRSMTPEELAYYNKNKTLKGFTND